jgi:hypothetical protein
MNVGIGTAAAQFLSWEYLFRIFRIVSLQCVPTSANTATMVASLSSLCLLSVWQIEALPMLPTTEVRCGAKISAIARMSDSKIY